MLLDSVRSLKQEISQSFVADAANVVASASTFGISARRLDRQPRVVRSMALGVSTGANKEDYRLAIRLQQRAMEDHPEVARLVQQAKGEADVRYVGRISKMATGLRSRRRPLEVGVSVGHFLITAGTLGCFVSREKGRTCILSNNHVLANEDQAAIGDPIIQPGDFDGGTNPLDRVARLTDFVRLDLTAANIVDAAIAEIDSSIEFKPRDVQDIGMLTGKTATVFDDSAVRKVGRTTGFTTGRVTAFEIDNVVVAYDIGDLRFDNQIEVEGSGSGPFSQGGDSGSLVVDEENNAIGLLFAGGDQGGSNGQGLTYLNPIDDVLSKLGVTIVV